MCLVRFTFRREITNNAMKVAFFKISEFSLSFDVRGKDTPFGKHMSNTQTIWQLSAGDEKLIPDLKNNI